MSLLPLAIFWSLAIWGLVSRRPVLLYLLFATMPFGAFAAVPPDLSAGLTLTATSVTALLMVCRHFARRGSAGTSFAIALAPSQLLLLFLFWMVAAMATLFMPRIFAELVEVVPMRSRVPDLLEPTAQNISQLGYLTISVLTVFVFASILRSGAMRQHALKALTLGGAVTVVTGALDFASLYLPIAPLLESFRTASYALATDVEFMSGKRVVGLMPEASAFGSTCLGFLAAIYFFRRCLQDGLLRDRAIPVLLVLLLVMTWLSTSSAAYVGLALFGTVAVIEWLWRASTSSQAHAERDRRGLFVELWVLLGAIAALCIVVLVDSRPVDIFLEIVDRMVLRKTTTASFDERSLWTQVSWQALQDTFGLGVGLGGTRASNSFVAVVSSTGVLGVLLYYSFVIRVLSHRAPSADPHGAAMIGALRWSFAPGFLVGALINTSPDFGLFEAFRYGLGTALGIGSAMAMADAQTSAATSDPRDREHAWSKH